MIRVLPFLSVKIADQCLLLMRPISIKRGSPCVRAGTWSRSGSSHSAWASTKSMPCLLLFASLFSESNSNFMMPILYLHYTGCQPVICFFLIRTSQIRIWRVSANTLAPTITNMRGNIREKKTFIPGDICFDNDDDDILIILLSQNASNEPLRVGRRAKRRG